MALTANETNQTWANFKMKALSRMPSPPLTPERNAMHLDPSYRLALFFFF
jgi:hypothetical protein